MDQLWAWTRLIGIIVCGIGAVCCALWFLWLGCKEWEEKHYPNWEAEHQQQEEQYEYDEAFNYEEAPDYL